MLELSEATDPRGLAIEVHLGWHHYTTAVVVCPVCDGKDSLSSRVGELQGQGLGVCCTDDPNQTWPWRHRDVVARANLAPTSLTLRRESALTRRASGFPDGENVVYCTWREM